MEDDKILKGLLELVKPTPANSNQQETQNTKIPITLEISVNVVVKNQSIAAYKN